MSAGPVTTRATYSWTKSRTIGINPKYRNQFSPLSYPQYQPGATFQNLPEHTWGLGITYGNSNTSLTINATSTGQLRTPVSAFWYQNLSNVIRLQQNQLSMGVQGRYAFISPGQTLEDVIATHKFSSRAEGVLDVRNLSNRYANERDAMYATIGRQIKIGLRLHID